MERIIKPTYDELESYVENLQKQRADAQATIAALQAALDSERAQSLRHVEEAMNLRAQLTQRTAELEALRPLYDDMWKQFAESQAELERVKQALCDADERANEYQKALHDFESERALPLSIELERVRDQFADLRKMVAALPKVEVVTGDTVVNIVQQYNFHQWMLRALQHRQGMEG